VPPVNTQKSSEDHARISEKKDSTLSLNKPGLKASCGSARRRWDCSADATTQAFQLWKGQANFSHLGVATG
jgi:hypothetical protein